MKMKLAEQSYVDSWSIFPVPSFWSLFRCHNLIAPLAVILVVAAVSASWAVMSAVAATGSILVLDGGFLIGLLLEPATIRLPGTFT